MTSNVRALVDTNVSVSLALLPRSTCSLFGYVARLGEVWVCAPAPVWLPYGGEVGNGSFSLAEACDSLFTIPRPSATLSPQRLFR